MHTDSSLLKWTRINLAMTLMVITLGALARLLDAGLGCPDWPGCYGQFIPPHSTESIQQANATHPLFPVEHIKAWSEMIHRYAASALGLSLLLLVGFIIGKEKYNNLKPVSFIALAWVVLQGLFGMLTVTLRIWPPVVTLHLLAGMIMLTLTYTQYRLVSRQNLPRFEPKYLPDTIKVPLLSLIIITFIQMGLGGWTSSQYAGLACPDLPQCQNQWWPETVNGPFHAPMVKAQEYLGGLLPMADRMAIQIIHRFTACLLILSALVLCARLFLLGKNNLIALIITPIVIQVLIGIANVYLLLPLPLALLHNTGAAILWLCLWWAYFSLVENTSEIHQ